ncbi:gustatory receptor for sugar taste 64f-like isoform X2 [Leptopilina boulardi]|uniref:gustatory receptor for sugar taste 64f-like isoform X2 n=1 Tax=Leptopilina boulardi TaxID=63433 RepID=UPI0021F581C5|nr:gustatory receptor for sugar taste 64f-like isoform X2 [Leptopilina boulardi]
MKSSNFELVTKTSAVDRMLLPRSSKIIPSSNEDNEGFEGEESNLSVIHSSRLFKSDSLLERFLKETEKMENSPKPASPIVNNQRKIFNSDSFIVAIRPIIVLAQCFALLPVDGTNTTDAREIKFTWKSLKVFYCFVATIGTAVLTGFSIHGVATSTITSKKTTNVVFFATTGVTTLLLLKLARKWPEFSVTWQNMEQELSMRRNRRISKYSLAAKFKIITFIIMMLAALEHTLSILSGYVSAVECTALKNDTDIMIAYFTYHYPQILKSSTFTIWQGILVQFVNILSTFSWNFIDLFLILISIAATDQFRQLNSRLYAIRGKAMPEWWWAEARIDFNRLSTMTRYIDSHISDIVLLSFSTNLYFICIQLLHSFNFLEWQVFSSPMRNAVQTTYFCFSFGFLLVRTAAVSLFAAGVHDESVLAAPILYSVSTSNYSPEVDRFLTQVTTDNISFTGMKFFSITRGLVLTVCKGKKKKKLIFKINFFYTFQVAGTIVTYELVLVQFNSVQQNEPSNITKVCELK